MDRSPPPPPLYSHLRFLNLEKGGKTFTVKGITEISVWEPELGANKKIIGSRYIYLEGANFRPFLEET